MLGRGTNRRASGVAIGEAHDFATRINELGNKSTQLLLFLTFAILGAVTLTARDCAGQERLVRSAIWWWMFAVFPVLLGVLPVKDFNWNNCRWYRFLVHAKCLFLWASVILSGIGAVQFLRAVR
ncbi:MAG TPA: hypothetical protein VFP91_02475 [Vicinamibacterales bacterium]|nr:hypothetical protein [Vicinamibacterales bacterium]